MPSSPKLKVFRTAIGFHDAYVAAPSRAAALRAWGSDKDLFARGAAEQVTDPALGAEPLASPGTVIKRLRGTEDEQLAALPPGKSAKSKAGASRAGPATKSSRPSRRLLDAAEAALNETEEAQVRARQDLIEREAAIARERRALETDQRKELARLMRARDRAAEDFDEAMRRWRS